MPWAFNRLNNMNLVIAVAAFPTGFLTETGEESFRRTHYNILFLLNKMGKMEFQGNSS